MRRSASRPAALAALLAAASVCAAVASAHPGSAAAPPRGATLAALAAPPTVPAIARERIYMVMTDRYANGDPSNDRGGRSGGRAVTGLDPSATGWFHGGDFRGLTGSCTDPVHGLARIRDLGFNAIWVTPPVVNQTVQGGSAGYHGYWGLDFTNVDPHLGSNEDFGAFVACAHSLGLKVIMDVVVNHTGDVVRLAGGSSFSDAPYRDCRGRTFSPAAYVGRSTFPCLRAATMPRRPTVPPALAHVKKPGWLNDPLDYHDRGDIDFSSCSPQCFEQGDFYGLDDLFTEKPSVERGLAQVYAAWIARYKLDGFRVDTARHVNAGFFRLWVPQILAAARAAGVKDFQVFGEAAVNDAAELSAFVRDRGLPNVLDFPLQQAAADYVAGAGSAVAVADRLAADDYFRTASGVEPAPPTFLGNHDLGRAAQQIRSRSGLDDPKLLQRVLLGYDLLYLLRGAPVVTYGDEVGMIGTGGDQQARQDMFPTAVAEWKTQERVGAPPIGGGSSFEVSTPIAERLRELGRLRDELPALSTGAAVVRLASKGLLAVSRIDAGAKRELLAVFNAGGAPGAPERADLDALGRLGGAARRRDGCPQRRVGPPDGRRAPALVAAAARGRRAGPARGRAGAEGRPRRPDDVRAPAGHRRRRAGERLLRDPPRQRRLAARRGRRRRAVPRVPGAVALPPRREGAARRDRARARREARGLPGADRDAAPVLVPAAS